MPAAVVRGKPAGGSGATAVTHPLMVTLRKVGWSAFGTLFAWFVIGGFTGLWRQVGWLLGIGWFLALAGVYALWRERQVRAMYRAGLPTPGFFELHVLIAKAQKRRALVHSRFARAAENRPKLQGTVNGEKKRVRLDKLDLTADGNVSAVLDMSAVGRTVEDLLAEKSAIEGVTRCRNLVVRPRDKGVAVVVFQYTDPLYTVLPFEDLSLPVSKRAADDPPRAVGGVDETGAPLEVSTDKPTMIGGETGSGKSVFAWGLIGSLIQQGLWIKLLMVDPKGGAEFGRFKEGLGKEWQHRLMVESFYGGEDIKEGKKVISHAYNMISMRSKANAAKGVRKVSAGHSKDEPLIVLVIDEALDYSSELTNEASDLIKYARKCRAQGGWLLAVFQFGHASAIGTGQKVFAARFCFRAAKETGDTILGTGAYALGARVNEIPRKQPGIGYYVDDEGYMLRFRAPNVTNAVADLLAVGQLPPGMGDARASAEPEHAVYRLFLKPGTARGADADDSPGGRCGYVGETNNWDRRQKEHELEKARFGEVDWWQDVDWNHPMTGVYWQKNYKTAKALETRWIKKYGPLYNAKENEANLLRKEWRKDRKTTVVQLRPVKPLLDTDLDEVEEVEAELLPLDAPPPADPILAYGGRR